MSEEYIDLIFDRLFDYFKVGTISDLAKKMDIPQSTISKWKQRNSVSAIKKVCRELSIYREIFGEDMAKNIQKNYVNYGNNSFSGDIRTPSHNSNSISLTLDNDLLQQLKALAEKEFRPLDMQIKKLLVEALEKK